MAGEDGNAIVAIVVSGRGALEVASSLLRDETGGVVLVYPDTNFAVTYSDGRVKKWPPAP